MKPSEQFLKQPKNFWANVRTISERKGYTARGSGQIKIPSLVEVRSALEGLGLRADHIVDNSNRLTSFGEILFGYFEHRALVLNAYVEPRLI